MSSLVLSRLNYGIRSCQAALVGNERGCRPVGPLVFSSSTFDLYSAPPSTALVEGVGKDPIYTTVAFYLVVIIDRSSYTLINRRWPWSFGRRSACLEQPAAALSRPHLHCRFVKVAWERAVSSAVFASFAILLSACAMPLRDLRWFAVSDREHIHFNNCFRRISRRLSQ